MNSFWVEAIGVAAAILTTIGFVSQVYRALISKDVKSISFEILDVIL